MNVARGMCFDTAHATDIVTKVKGDNQELPNDIIFSFKSYLSYLSRIIGNPCHKLNNSLTHSLTQKLVEIVAVADVDDEDRVGNSLLQISKLRFDHKAKHLFRL